MSGAPSIEITPAEFINTQIAKEQWGHYQKQAVPLEKKYMGMVNRQNDAAHYNQAAALAQGGVVEQYDPMLKRAAAQAMEQGVSPASGRALMGMADLRAQGAKAMGQAAAQSQTEQHNRYLGGLENILGIGRGQAGTAQAGMADAAQQSIDAAKSRFQTQWESDQALGSAIGTVGGAAARPFVNKSLKDAGAM